MSHGYSAFLADVCLTNQSRVSDYDPKIDLKPDGKRAIALLEHDLFSLNIDSFLGGKL